MKLSKKDVWDYCGYKGEITRVVPLSRLVEAREALKKEIKEELDAVFSAATRRILNKIDDFLLGGE